MMIAILSGFLIRKQKYPSLQPAIMTKNNQLFDPGHILLLLIMVVL
jgi:hypothetical protein